MVWLAIKKNFPINKRNQTVWSEWNIFMLHFIKINLKTKIFFPSMSNFLILRISTLSHGFCYFSFRVSQPAESLRGHLWQFSLRVRERDSVAIRCRVAKSVSVLNPLPDCSLECHTVLTQGECVHVCFCTLSDCIRKTRLQSAGALKGSCLNGLETYCKRHPSV